MTIGSARPMEDAARIAYRELVRWMAADFGFEELEAYMLLTQCGQVRLGNMVDPKYTLGASMQEVDRLRLMVIRPPLPLWTGAAASRSELHAARQSAVDDEIGPRDEARSGAGEEHGRIGHFLRRAHPAGRIESQRRLVEIRVAILDACQTPPSK